MHTTPTAEEHLKGYVNARLPQIKEGFFEGVEDLPSFTVDQSQLNLMAPTY